VGRAWVPERGKKPDGERIRFFYDAFRRRVRKEIHPPLTDVGAIRASRVVEFVWDQGTLCAEIDSERGKRFFVFAPDTFVPLLQSQHDEVFACVTDYMGTPRELIDGAGQVAWAADHDSWGRVDRETADPASRHGGKVASPFRTQGQYWDEETALAYAWHRYFDPAIGRFISPDPIELDGGGNMFGLNGAPTVTIDPTGLANPYDIGTYGTQNGGGNVGDGLDADELLLNGFIKARQSQLLPGNEYGGHGSGNASRDNPTIALPGRGSSGTHAAGHAGEHGQVWDAELAAGLHDPAKLAGMTAKQVINKKAGLLRKVLVKNGFSKKEAKKIVDALKKDAIAHAKNIFPPCVHGY
jgi:RHS repeat-associated protein